MTTEYRHKDGTVHFSDLKRIGTSPAHFRYAMTAERKQTREMRIGTAVHAIVLGQRPECPAIRFEGDDRRGNAWNIFRLAHPNAEILTAPEWADAEAIAASVRAHPVAWPMIQGARKEVPLKWTDAGIPCGTGGVDLIGEDWIGDLKTSQCSEPAKFMKMAMNLGYPQQLAFYKMGCELNAIKVNKGYIFAVETKPPYPVTVFCLTPATLDFGKRSYSMWLEKLRSCEENDFWPAYAQSIVDFELPAWLSTDDEDDDVEEELT